MRVAARIPWFDSPTTDRGTRFLLAGTLLNVLGYQLFVPILPLYLSRLGASPQSIGLLIGIGLLCYGLGQYPAGVLADRFDRRVCAAVASAAYGLLFIPYLLPLSLELAMPIRLSQAFVGGFFAPIALALAADLAPIGDASRAYGRWQATVMAGFLVGPLVGGILVAQSFSVLFIAAAALCVMSAIPLLAIRLPADRRSRVGSQPRGNLSFGAVSQIRWMLPAIGAGAAAEFLSGAFLSTWGIFLVGSGGEAWQVGLSYTLFALPAVLLSVWFGGLIDRRGVRPVLAIALGFLAVLSPLYALVASVPVLMLLVLAQGVAVSAQRPAVYSEVARVVPPDYHARAQGILLTGLTAAQSVGAIASGFLYGLSPSLVFSSVALIALLSLVAVPFMSPRTELRSSRSSLAVVEGSPDLPSPD